MSTRAILFLCTGNAYRSRYAEAWFNYLCLQNEVQNLRAFSRGLNITAGTIQACPGGHYPETLEQIQRKNIPMMCTGARPVRVTDRDFKIAELTICMYKIEHKPYIDKNWSCATPIYWDIPDEFYARRDCPEFEKLPRKEGFKLIEDKVEDLFKNIAFRSSDYII